MSDEEKVPTHPKFTGVKKSKKKQYLVLLPDEPNGRTSRLRHLWRSTTKRTGEGGVPIPAETKEMAFSPNGIMVIPAEGSPYYDEMIAKTNHFVGRNFPKYKIIGPFADSSKAVLARQEESPKTEATQIAILKDQLDSAKSTVISELSIDELKKAVKSKEKEGRDKKSPSLDFEPPAPSKS